MGRTPIELLSDPDEGRFLQALLADPDDDATRLVYADWLEERGDLRGELLRIEAALRKGAQDSEQHAALRARFRALRQTADATWVRLALKDSTVLNCGAASAGAPMIRFAFECPMTWETLKPTPENSVRFCDSCERKVYFCRTAEQARLHAQAGDCIAIETGLDRAVTHHYSGHMVGRPERADFYRVWSQDILEGRDPNLESTVSREVSGAKTSTPPVKRWWQFWK
jgi:uncharacterized protein (TIGR02996 family)